MKTRVAAEDCKSAPPTSTTGRVLKKNPYPSALVSRFRKSLKYSGRMLLSIRSPIASHPHDLLSPFSCMRNSLFDIRRDEIKLTKVLGAGGFGRVHKGTARNNEVAIKIFHPVTKNKKAQIQSFKAELNILHLKHINVIRILTSSAANSIENPEVESFTVMEYVGTRNLSSVIHRPDEALTSALCRQFSHDIASALVYTHSHGIMHLDVKPANILLTPTNVCKLGDFGCSMKEEALKSGEGFLPHFKSYLTGTFAYRAPELLRGKCPTTKADVYSLAITFWELLTRQTPYDSENQHVVIFGVVAKNLRPQSSQSVSQSAFTKAFRELYTKCWSPDPDNRPTSIAVLHIVSSLRKLL